MHGNAFIHFLKYFLRIDNAHTQTSLNERRLLADYVSASNCIVEIGVFEGVNTLNFAINSPSHAKIYAIDPFYKGFLRFNYGKVIAKYEWYKNGVSDKISIIEGLSHEVLCLIPGEIDFVFIDGDHSYEGVKRDLDTYTPKLKCGGVIALHDARLFSNGWTRPDWGPVELVNKHIRNSDDWEIVDEVDSLVLIRKKCG